MKAPRKPRSDSTTAKVLAFQKKTPAIPAHVHLRDCDLPYWRVALSCRDDWQGHELESLGQYSRAMADIERLTFEIENDGEILDGKLNPKLALVETLSRRVMSLCRHLQIHGRAQRGESRDVARKELAPTIGGTLTDLGDMSDLINRPL